MCLDVSMYIETFNLFHFRHGISYIFIVEFVTSRVTYVYDILFKNFFKWKYMNITYLKPVKN